MASTVNSNTQIDHLFKEGFSLYEQGSFRMLVPNSLFADRSIAIPKWNSPEKSLSQLFVKTVTTANSGIYTGCHPEAILEKFVIQRDSLKGKQVYLLIPKELEGNSALASKIRQIDALPEEKLGICLQVAAKIYTLDANLKESLRECAKTLLPTKTSLFLEKQQPLHLLALCVALQNAKEIYEKTLGEKFRFRLVELEKDLVALKTSFEMQKGSKTFSKNLTILENEITKFINDMTLEKKRIDEGFNSWELPENLESASTSDSDWTVI